MVEFKTSSPVASIETTANGTRTVFVENGVAKEVHAQKVMFSAAVNLAPALIKDLGKYDPDKTRAISDIEMTDYAVHVVHVKGHPYRATYDTWSNSGGDLSKPTDFILGRWQDPKIRAYEGQREFGKNPADDYGVITIYQPLGSSNPTHFNKDQNLKMVEDAVYDMTAKLSGLGPQAVQPIEVELIESYRWPESIHVVKPGYLKKFRCLLGPSVISTLPITLLRPQQSKTAMGRAAQEALNIIAKWGHHQ